MLANTDNSVDRLVELSQETYLCPSITGYITPLRALNTAGKWRIVVNGVKVMMMMIVMMVMMVIMRGFLRLPFVSSNYDDDTTEDEIRDHE